MAITKKNTTPFPTPSPLRYVIQETVILASLCASVGLSQFGVLNNLPYHFNHAHPHPFMTWALLSGVPDYFGRNKISSGGDLSHYSSASLY